MQKPAATQSHLHPWPGSTSERRGGKEEGWNGRWPDRTARQPELKMPSRGGSWWGCQARCSQPPAFLSLSLVSFHKLLTCTCRLRSCCLTRLSALASHCLHRVLKIRDAHRDSGAPGRAPLRGQHALALPFPGILPSRLSSGTRAVGLQ